MTAIFKRHELPLAASMIAAANRVRPRRDGRHPYDKYFLFWTAFNNIYSTIAAREGRSTELVIGEDGSVETYPNGNVKIPKVKTAGEREQVYLAVGTLSGSSKDRVIRHESIKFFASRVPFWQGKPIEQDAFGQRINGVINVVYTIGADYPVWSPIDIAIYEDYLAKPDDEAARDFLTQQIADLLYTVRKNLMLFSREFDDSNDIAVIENATPLLALIVEYFIR